MRSSVVAPEMIQARARGYTEWAQTLDQRERWVGIDCEGDDDGGGSGGSWKVTVESWLSKSKSLLAPSFLPPSCPTHFLNPPPTSPLTPHD
jgi:hypothetical protein